MGKVLSGIEVAKTIDERTKDIVSILEKDYNTRPVLVLLEASENGGVQSYKKNIVKKAEQLNIGVISCYWDSNDKDTSMEDVAASIVSLNETCQVHSILLLKPFEVCQKDQQILWNLIDESKDVDMISDKSLGTLINTSSILAPSTVQACFAILDYYKISCRGKRVLVIGRSPTVGKPAALVALNKDATVTIAHSKTKDLQSLIDENEIIICAVGKPNFITKDMVNSNHIIIDVGINVVDGKVIGDVEAGAIDIVKAMTPVPRGVGSVTTSALMMKVVLAALHQVRERKNESN